MELKELATVILGICLGGLCAIPIGYLIVYILTRGDDKEKVEAIPDIIIIIAEEDI